ncbi:unnamed protein product [Urochloa humidicola]
MSPYYAEQSLGILSTAPAVCIYSRADVLAVVTKTALDLFVQSLVRQLYVFKRCTGHTILSVDRTSRRDRPHWKSHALKGRPRHSAHRAVKRCSCHPFFFTTWLHVPVSRGFILAGRRRLGCLDNAGGKMY